MHYEREKLVWFILVSLGSYKKKNLKNPEIPNVSSITNT